MTGASTELLELVETYAGAYDAADEVELVLAPVPGCDLEQVMLRVGPLVDSAESPHVRLVAHVPQSAWGDLATTADAVVLPAGVDPAVAAALAPAAPTRTPSGTSDWHALVAPLPKG